jgi:hypothetical protein
MTIAVPVGKRILISNKGWSQTNVRINNHGMQSETYSGFKKGGGSDGDWFNEWNEPWDNDSYSYEQGIEYRMTATGLEKIRRMDESEKQEDKNDTSEKEAEKIKKEREALPTKKVAQNSSVNFGNISKVSNTISEMHWVIERFTY